MKVETEKLVKFNTFASNYVKKDGKKGCSYHWVEYLEAQGSIEVVRIDGVKFVILK